MSHELFNTASVVPEDGIASLESQITPITPSAVRMLAVRVLNETSRTGTLRRSDKGGGSLQWNYLKPDWELFERGAFYVKHQEDLWRMRYQHLVQPYQGFDDPFDDGRGYDYFGSWRGAQLTDVDVEWTSREILSATKTVSLVPALAEDEIETIYDQLLMNQVTEEAVGSDTYQQLRDISQSRATPQVKADVKCSDVERAQKTITRLNRIKVRRRQSQSA